MEPGWHSTVASYPAALFLPLSLISVDRLACENEQEAK